jgi:hypothetical protein
MFTWMPLAGLPHPPDHFINRALTIAEEGPEKHDNIVSNYYIGGAEAHVDRTVVSNGKEYSSRYQVGYEIGDDFNQWVKDNIVENFVNATVRRSVGKSEMHGAHIDNSRKYAIWYMLERGGEDSRTRFYYEKGGPIEWPWNEKRVFNNMDDLIELEAVKWPIRQWFVINTSVIHAITDITGPRTSLQISVLEEQLPYAFGFVK